MIAPNHCKSLTINHKHANMERIPSQNLRTIRTMYGALQNYEVQSRPISLGAHGIQQKNASGGARTFLSAREWSPSAPANPHLGFPENPRKPLLVTPPSHLFRRSSLNKVENRRLNSSPPFLACEPFHELALLLEFFCPSFVLTPRGQFCVNLAIASSNQRSKSFGRMLSPGSSHPKLTKEN
jgi:hypothetical protein